MNRSITRRHFHCLGLAAAAPAWLPRAAQAQGGPVEGKHFVRLSQPVAPAAAGKVEVVEFFWYGCPHCFSLEPFVEQWLAKLPADVAFRRVPAAFTPQYEFHQKVFYAFEALGLLGSLHRKFFNAIHVDRKRLVTEADVAAFVSANGADGAKVADAMKSFSVIGKARQAKQLSDAYGVDSVPMLGVQGRFRTSAAMAGGVDKAFLVVDHLVELARKG
ncbi:thiol:disulfide interchange protein DsbA/DsbL [Ideonella sp.]|uniref:thiol:disulfide interchange protein DsbA/DsbL n=1 Tax=Ideonella sp. TaxID=1929293 RepID=UPI0035B00A9A